MAQNTIIIRPIEEKDLQSLGNIIMAAKQPQFVEEKLTETVINEMRKKYSQSNLKLKIANNFYYVAELPEKNKVVGVIGLRKDDGGDIYNRLSMFFIDPIYQKIGIGRLLYEKVKEKAKEVGCSKMVVSSSPYAEPIYAHFGFKRVRIIWKDHENGSRSHTVWMEQNL